MSVQSLGGKVFFPTVHLEQICRGVSALTVDPYKNALYYFFPFIAAFFNDYQELRIDPSHEAMMPEGGTRTVLKEVQDLTQCAGIQRQVVPYIALNHEFYSSGGRWSITKPALFLPFQHVFRQNGHSPLGQEREGENLRGHPWIFSDLETKFLIARELGQINENSALLRIAIKVTVIAALFVIYASPFGLPLGTTLFVVVLGMYLVSERVFQARADIVGTQILGKKTGNAVQVAIDTLEKMRQQNLFRRKHCPISRWYILESGNNILDFTHPYLTTRIERLRSRL